MPPRDWDPLEAAAFLYYYSRGMPSALVADFIFRKCGKTSEPPTEEHVLQQKSRLPWVNKKSLNLAIVNRLLAQAMERDDLTWKDFLAKMEFDSEERASLKGKGFLNLIESTKKIQDPLVSQMLKRAPKGAFRPGTTVALAASLPGSDPSLLAPSPIPNSGLGAGYLGFTGDASGVGGGYGSTPYPSTLQGPGYSAGTSTGYASADLGYPSSQQAFQGSGQSAYRNTGHMSPPHWQDDPEEDDIEQEVSDPQPQKSRRSQQPPPSTQALPRRYWKDRPEGVQEAIRKEKQDKQIAKSEGLKRQREKTQQRNDAKFSSQAEQTAKARAQARQAAEEDLSASPSSDGESEDDPSNRQPRKRRRAQKDRARSRSRSLSRLRRLAENIELPKIYHGRRRDDVREMAPLIATLSTWASLNQKYGGKTDYYYTKYMLSDPETWGWIEIERVKNIKAQGRQGIRGSDRGGSDRKGTGQQQKR